MKRSWVTAKMDSAIDLAVDTSALVAILLNEPECDSFLRTLSASGRIGISAVNKAELLMVILSRLGEEGVARTLDLLAMYGIQVISADDGCADLAAEAFAKFGKGRHPAGLNFVDCFAYALAKRCEVPLLFKGNDFSRTDIVGTAE